MNIDKVVDIMMCWWVCVCLYINFLPRIGVEVVGFVEDDRLKDLVGSCLQFTSEIERRVLTDPTLANQLKKAAEPEKLDQFGDLLHEFYCVGKEFTEHFKTGLQVSDMAEQFAEKVLTKDQLVKCLPEELKSKEVVAQLRQHGAYNLANLCEHAISSHS